MHQNDILVKWTGSKRLQAPDIVRFFPRKIATYYEPFLGGGSVLYTLLSSDIEVDHYECSDANEFLMGVWDLVQHNPSDLFDFYVQHWPCNRDTYYRIKEEFNQDHDPKKFFLLLRTCRNGAVRFNSKNQFNIAFHEKRCGISPDTLRLVLDDWHKKLQRVQLIRRDYREVKSESADVVYLDPPYPTETAHYFGSMDYEALWMWIQSQKGCLVLSLSGMEVPRSAYKNHYRISGGFHRMNRKCRVEILDDLYVR